MPFVLALFYHRQYHLFAFTGPTDYWPVFSCHWPLFSRHSPLPPKTLPRWLLPATDSRIAKDRMGPIWPSGPSILVMHRNRRFLRRIQSVPPHSPPPDR